MSDAAWMSESEAARQLGVSVLRIGALVSCDHLTLAKNPAGHVGITAASVRTEKHWKQTASRKAKLIRLLKDMMTFV
ncbi:DNA-binding protein [Actinacidiphila acididurans]|uniref:DNA-binding protein n=1 Tax=Actinacidiphila acididurans TaxID=2784346 RepID=A0ABS2TX62_9ACTN|nr:DNA-binding protein [Actinacidiphila acididurans]MBM9507924.1 DNA-binding protein [Actinacidiphila acididurans]